LSEIAQVWFNQAKKLEVGQAIFVRVANKKEQTIMANEFETERTEFSRIDTVHASQIFINKTLKDSKQYVVLERKFRAPFTAFFRDQDGGFSTVSIDPERERMISLMLKDGKKREEIEDTLNGLTSDEILDFFT